MYLYLKYLLENYEIYVNGQNDLVQPQVLQVMMLLVVGNKGS